MALQLLAQWSTKYYKDTLIAQDERMNQHCINLGIPHPTSYQGQVLE